MTYDVHLEIKREDRLSELFCSVLSTTDVHMHTNTHSHTHTHIHTGPVRHFTMSALAKKHLQNNLFSIELDIKPHSNSINQPHKFLINF